MGGPLKIGSVTIDTLGQLKVGSSNVQEAYVGSVLVFPSATTTTTSTTSTTTTAPITTTTSTTTSTTTAPTCCYQYEITNYYNTSKIVYYTDCDGTPSQVTATGNGSQTYITCARENSLSAAATLCDNSSVDCITWVPANTPCGGCISTTTTTSTTTSTTTEEPTTTSTTTTTTTAQPVRVDWGVDEQGSGAVQLIIKDSEGTERVNAESQGTGPITGTIYIAQNKTPYTITVTRTAGAEVAQFRVCNVSTNSEITLNTNVTTATNYTVSPTPLWSSVYATYGNSNTPPSCTVE